jgi:hypothetical protein
MRKKFNKLNLINRSSTTDLKNLAESIGLTDLRIIRKNELPLYIDKFENIIMNLDSVGGGTHWTSLNTKHKIYFDSYNQPKPQIVPRDYRQANSKFELQSINGRSSEMCGQLSVLVLYYLQKYNNPNIGLTKFYEKFKDVYK